MIVFVLATCGFGLIWCGAAAGHPAIAMIGAGFVVIAATWGRE